ncbi:purine-cytosine permease family protein [Mycobacteroides abscessus]|uniref:purine-cytosine permease family protein n=1 Tax=Mycobacteroides abscessus TaxID=36809 RepID=UPI000929F9BD|nr:cytosine permease [Mycobacteroides abscessus]SHR30772.1 permease for cytosine/purines uracil thiamine allantoin [Mycobacteroides abscessus subsp. bolletii]SHT32730.1 permease for cytosine/purines uracil thiamine allantoin [Mycobacteroides abscessus subsp. bolletii]SHT50974.1 permease for cytosine/purines uracil thiamine allantoin [Mycobacteroides abscessus subsp. bolletii]SKG63963.1 permease for cytosine/purines uracil thiamine allantoin [Mycobacteroides abscessus subsp. bolletii]SKH19331.1
MSVLNPERRSIEYVPLHERHGHARSLFTLWFGTNLQVTAIAAGAISVAIGLSLPWALLASLLGNLIGAIFMALHSAQGPILGIPQMIQSRAQFGFYGAVLPLILVILMYIGYVATTAVQGGAAFSSLTSVNIDASIVIVMALTVVLAIFGYRLIHTFEKVLSVVSGLAFLYLSYRLMTTNDLGAVWHADGFSWALFLAATAIAATWQLTYAPYVADYSRYLPADTSVRATFWFTYAGTVLSTMFMFAFGATAAAVAATAFDGGSVDFIVDQAAGLHAVFFLIIIAGVIGMNSLNLYGMFMSTTTVLNSVFKMKMSSRLRAVLIVVVAAVATTTGLVGKDNFLTNFSNFILLLAYFLVPWTSINLADFYLVRKERYSIDDMFKPQGHYGGVDWRAMTAYLVGIVVEVPFITSPFYTGPVATWLHGANISWILGICIAGGLYAFLMKRYPSRSGYPEPTYMISPIPTVHVAAAAGEQQAAPA